MKEIIKSPILFFLAMSIIVTCTSLGSAIMIVWIYAITVILILFKDGFKPLINRSVLFFLGFVVVMVVYSFFGKGTLNAETIREKVFWIISMVSVFIMSYHTKTLNIGQIKALVKVSLIAILFTLVGTTIVGFTDPMAIRSYGFGVLEGEEIEIAARYRSMGMMSYSLAHAMSLVAIVLSIILCFSRNKFFKLLSIVMLFMIIRLLFMMTITTALLLAVIGVTIVFASFFSRGKTVLAMGIVVGMFILFFLTGLSAVLLDFSDEANTQIFAKLSDLFVSLQTGSGEGQMGYREELYRASFNTFLSNPFFGWGSDNGSQRFVGGHSFILDYLAYFGIFAVLLFVAWWKEYKSLKPYLSRKLLSYYYYAFIPVVGLWALKAESVCGVLPFMALIVVRLVFLNLENDNHE